MHLYDASRFDPPAPLALVTVSSAHLGVTIENVPMLIDTGADVSLLPRAHVTSLVPADAKSYELEAFDGTKSTAPAICTGNYLATVAGQSRNTGLLFRQTVIVHAFDLTTRITCTSAATT